MTRDDLARHLRPLGIAAVALVLIAVGTPPYLDWVRGLPAHDDDAEAVVLDAAAGDIDPRLDPELALGIVDDGHDHDHSDLSTKNSLSRTTPDEADDLASLSRQAAGHRSVQDQRDADGPELSPMPLELAHEPVPADRYAMAGGCYALADERGRWVVIEGGVPRAIADSMTEAAAFHFKAIDLGEYLLWSSEEAFLQASARNVTTADAPSPATEWTVEEAGGGFTLTHDSHGAMNAEDDGRLTTGATQAFTLHLTDGCATWPDIETGVSGDPHGGTTPFQEVRGYLDAHVHHMAFEFLGGKVHCGRPWHPYGVESALVDCPDHYVADGHGALLENLVSSGSPVGSHDPVGWPTFHDWPAPHSLTHEGTYHRWVERSWRGGQRIFVNLLVENNKLCEIYPLQRNSCDDMDSIRLQAEQMRAFERYVDAQWGGPGQGWYRIVTDPFEAREVINSGRLAVIMGIETSVPFGCTMFLDIPQCSQADIDEALDELYDLGVRQLELVNKFDNALAGVAGDTGGVAPLINLANFAETGSFWAMGQCPTDEEGVHDRAQLTAPPAVPEQDALFGAIAELHLPLSLPLYGSAPHCNVRGLTDLGEYTVSSIAERGMIFDPDHMSVKAREAALDVLDEAEYSGVISSHSWSTPDAYPRVYARGGVITPYAGDSEGFVEKWHKHMAWVDERFYFGFGFGADINGLGPQGNPRGEDVDDPVTYPFEGLGGVVIDHQVSGERVYDINVDGVAHYGLYPDWVEDLRMIAGDDIVADLERGSEAYLQMWERAVGVRADACRDETAVRDLADFEALTAGSAVRDVLLAVGQPHQRRGETFEYCAAEGSDPVDVTVTFTDDGMLSAVDHRAGGHRGDPPGSDIVENRDAPAAVGGTGTDASGTAAAGSVWRPVTDLLPNAGSPAGLVLWAILGAGLLVLGGKMLRPGFARPSGRTRPSLRERSQRYRR